MYACLNGATNDEVIITISSETILSVIAIITDVWVRMGTIL